MKAHQADLDAYGISMKLANQIMNSDSTCMQRGNENLPHEQVDVGWFRIYSQAVKGG
jgi:hypothetical protein